jgi:hypothetical protein
MATATRRGAGAASPAKSPGRGAKKAAPSSAAAAPSSASSSPRSPLAQAFLQHGGLVFCVAGIALLAAGYGRGWMHDTHLTLLCVAFNLVGLFLHETRPFCLERELNAQRDAAQAAAAKRR